MFGNMFGGMAGAMNGFMPKSGSQPQSQGTQPQSPMQRMFNGPPPAGFGGMSSGQDGMSSMQGSLGGGALGQGGVSPLGQQSPLFQQLMSRMQQGPQRSPMQVGGDRSQAQPGMSYIMGMDQSMPKTMPMPYLGGAQMLQQPTAQAQPSQSPYSVGDSDQQDAAQRAGMSNDQLGSTLKNNPLWRG
jgi:hypothetical protein